MDPQLRNKIISEAYKLFILKGVKNTSLNDITKLVNKSKGRSYISLLFQG